MPRKLGVVDVSPGRAGTDVSGQVTGLVTWQVGRGKRRHRSPTLLRYA